MDSDILLAIYASAAVCILLIQIITGKKNKRYYDRLDKKEHPLRFFYPAAALIYSFFEKISGSGKDRNVILKIRRIYIKENVAEEVFLYKLKKISMILTIILCSSILGCMMCLAGKQISYLGSLERNEYGKGNADYSLNVRYDGEDETVQISLDEQKFTKQEIMDRFDEISEAVRKTMLGENTSAEYVTKPLDLISEYEGINISWEIEDPSIIDYNGNISETVKENDRLLLNIYATFKLDEVTETFAMPVVVSAGSPERSAKLAAEISENIQSHNSIYEKTVDLPDELDGKPVLFSKAEEHNEYIFLVLGGIAVLLIIFGYERTLDKQLNKRNEQMMLDFAEIVSKLSLLYEAGLSIYKAWERIVEDHEKKELNEKHFAYREMKMALEKIKSGMSEREAYAEFGRRCGLHPYIKLGNILEQNLSKGTKGMKLLLKQEVSDSFEERKRIAKKKGEEASTKLLFPMIIMLVVVIIIVAVPAIMSMSM